MKITKRQLRRIIREAIDPRELEEPLGGYVGDALRNDPDYAQYPPGRRPGAKARMNSKGYQDGLEGKGPVSMSSYEDPDYMAGKKAGERDRSNDPYADHSFIELDLDT